MSFCRSAIIRLFLAFSSQWYLTFKATPHLDKKHTVFGKLVGGEDVLDALEAVPIKPGTERPAKAVRITEVVMYVFPSIIYFCTRPRTNHPSNRRYQDPFEEYKTRAQKKRQKQAEAQENRTAQVAEKKDEDELNWFGVKLGNEKSAAGVVGGGVGKYLQVSRTSAAPKRPASKIASPDIPEDGKKKRKIGFGGFEGW